VKSVVAGGVRPVPFARTAPPSHIRHHITGAADHLANESDELRRCSPEQVLYEEYVCAGSPHGPALYAVKGEHWNGVSPEFLRFLNAFTFTPEVMGYAECGYGIQRHRTFLRNLIVAEHGLDARPALPSLDIDVGCLAMTTRMAMYDLAKVALRHSRTVRPGRRPVALVPTPGWDYRGIVKDVGFDVVYLPIRPENGWLPDLDEWSSVVEPLLADPDVHVALAASNPQHNPTGMQWPTEVTAYLLRLCAQESGYLVLDDAYYNVHDPRVPIVDTLKAVLDLFDEDGGDNALVRSGMFQRWMATRPFGKQFSCNTMAVAAITTSPRLLRQLARESWINRYHCNTHNAEVMCAWLATPEAAEWTAQTGLFYARQKALVRGELEALGWPPASVCTGPSAPAPYVRLHLGSHHDVIEEFLRRWRVAGLRYDQPAPFPGRESLLRPVSEAELGARAS
jgi:histidinol-phosphate/aromatic aminotransferase/cobyric acid decarboxylase-like protein